MAVQAQFGGGGFAEEAAQVRALKEYGALLYAATAAGEGLNNHQYNCGAAGVVSGAQSELTCNGGLGEVVVASRKRGREAELEQFVATSTAALLPIPGMQKPMATAQLSSPAAVANRTVDSALASTSGRPASASVADALAAELWQQGLELDAVVRAECEALRAGLAQARKRQCQALLARATSGAAARALREKEAELGAARRHAAQLEERLRQAAAEAQAWCGVARSNEAVAAGLRATLDSVLLRAAAAAPAAEGFGDSDDLAVAAAAAPAEDARSGCCFVEEANKASDAGGVDTAAGTSSSKKWACRGCGEAEASVLLLPCRHLCLCRACEPRADACPVCLAAKAASIHVAADGR